MTSIHTSTANQTGSSLGFLAIPPSIKIIAWRVCWVLLFIYSAFHIKVIIASSIDIPHYDEWELFTQNGIIQGWKWSFILRPGNEHQVILTKLIYLINLHFFDLNIRYQIFFNLFLYAILLVLIWRFIGRRVSDGNSFMALFTFTIFFSSMPYVFHTMGILLHIHLTLLNFLLGTYLLFEKEKPYQFLLGLFLLILAMFDFAGSVGAVIAVIFFFAFWALIKKIKFHKFKVTSAIIALSLSLYVWSIHYVKNPVHPPYAMPWSRKFIRFMAELISLGFGFTDVNPLPAYVCTVVVLCSLACSIAFLFRNKTSNNRLAFFIALILGILGMFSLTAFGRAEFPLEQAKTSHYSEFAIFLPLLTLALFYSSFRQKFLVGAIVFVLLGLGMYNNFGFVDYQTVLNWRLSGLKCIDDLKKFPEGNPKGICPTLFPEPITERLAIAKKLGISFLLEK